MKYVVELYGAATTSVSRVRIADQSRPGRSTVPSARDVTTPRSTTAPASVALSAPSGRSCAA